jgi:hypothetical protein
MAEDDAPLTPAQCRERAAECERLAEAAFDDENREIFLTLAARWRALAEAVEAPPGG